VVTSRNEDVKVAAAPAEETARYKEAARKPTSLQRKERAAGLGAETALRIAYLHPEAASHLVNRKRKAAAQSYMSRREGEDDTFTLSKKAGRRLLLSED
jgi:hypothetical protein